MEFQKKKCSSKKHEEIEANLYCQQCRLYMCNKCEKLHSELFQNHKIHNLDKDIKDIFTGFCKEENHLEKLQYFCKDHNKLCCSSCIVKIKRKGNGQHTDCNICNIEDIKKEKKNKLKENIGYLEELSKNLEKLICELKELAEKINKDKETLKMEIQKIFTKMRNTINEREDELLIEIDKQFDNNYFEENIINECEKLPNKVQISLEKGKAINNKWDENELNSLINDCINIENNIKSIKVIKDKEHKTKSNNITIKFEPDDEGINTFLKQIKLFGKLKINNSNNYFSFKECPINIKEDRKYVITGEKRNIITKTGKDGICMGTICENELEKDKEHSWIIKILKTKNYQIDVGVAPIDFDINSSKYSNCGWYFYCYNSTLESGPPHNYTGEKTNLNKVKDEIKIIMNMKQKTLKFIINNEDKGDSYTNIPTDKSLVPAVFLDNKDDSLEIIKC